MADLDRPAIPRTPEQETALARVRRAARAKRRADEEHRAAILAALELGLNGPEVAQAAGTTRQAVGQLAKRASPREFSAAV